MNEDTFFSERLVDFAKRRALRRMITLAFVGGIVLSGIKEIGQRLDSQLSRYVQQTSELLKHSPISFGFNTHLHTTNERPRENMNLASFVHDVETFSNLGAEYIRFNPIANEIATWNKQAGYYQFHEDNLQEYVQALAIAEQHKLKVVLVLSVPDLEENDQEGNRQKVEDYYRTVMKRFMGKVHSIQLVDNELNVHRMGNYEDIGLHEEDSNYVIQVAELVGLANRVVKEIDPDVRTTVNYAWVGWAGDHERRIMRYMGDPNDPASLVNQVDEIGLDLYPNPNQVEQISGVMNLLANYYETPLVIEEIGLPNFVPFRAEIVAWIVNQITQVERPPLRVLVYEARDQEPLQWNRYPLELPHWSILHEGWLGIMDADGNLKPDSSDFFQLIAASVAHDDQVTWNQDDSQEK